MQSVVESHYGGNQRNMSFEEEAEFLEQFSQKAEQGQMPDIHEIEEAYRKSRTQHWSCTGIPCTSQT